MSLSLILLPLLAQVGPGPALPQAPLEIKRKPDRVIDTPALPPSRLTQCLTLARSDPGSAVEQAETWLATVTGSARIEPGHCLGVALTGLGQLNEAEAAFLAARDDTPAMERANRARLGAMAGNAALAAGAPDRALAALDAAHGEALGAGNLNLAGEISIDRARALVLLKREGDAAAALASARTNAPENAAGWLLSATLSRRQGNLAEAQRQIELAAQLLPVDPEIGLEAGVIAALAGRDDAARRSFQSVLRAAPDSPSAKAAQGYLDQLGPDTTPSER